MLFFFFSEDCVTELFVFHLRPQETKAPLLYTDLKEIWLLFKIYLPPHSRPPQALYKQLEKSALDSFSRSTETSTHYFIYRKSYILG